MRALSITVPLPPSANALTRNTARGRAKTRAYSTWLEEAGFTTAMAWRGAGRPKFTPPLAITVRLGLANRRRDAGNCLKPIEDMLVKSIADLPDDRWNDRIIIERDASIAPGTAHVTISALGAGP